MRTPSPDPDPDPHPERYQREVQSRIQNLLSGQRPRHPVFSRYSTRRLILEGVLEEVRLYRVNQEQEVLKAREEAARMNERRGKERRSSGARQDYGRQQGESNSHGRRRGNHDDEKPLLVGTATAHDVQLQGRDPRFMMTGGASGLPSLDKATAQAKHCSPANAKKERGYTSLRSHSPGEGGSQGKQRFDRNGKSLVYSKRGWRDASTGPFPEYKFKMGPMLGLGDHLKERFNWGLDTYHLEQRRKERRERGGFDERRKVRKEKKANEKNEEAERKCSKDDKPMSKSEGKRPVKDDHAPHSRRGGPSNEALGSGRIAHARHVDKMRSGEQPEQDEGHRYKKHGGRRGAPGSRKNTARKAQAETDAQLRAERHARHEAEARSSSSEHQRKGQLDPGIPVYEHTRHSQRVEARERAEADQPNCK